MENAQTSLAYGPEVQAFGNTNSRRALACAYGNVPSSLFVAAESTVTPK